VVFADYGNLIFEAEQDFDMEGSIEIGYTTCEKKVVINNLFTLTIEEMKKHG